MTFWVVLAVGAALAAFAAGFEWSVARRYRRLHREVSLAVGGYYDLNRDLERRLKELNDHIDVVHTERDRWRDIYYVEASEHGRAQELLMRERSSLLHQMRAAGINPRVHPGIERVVSEHTEHHVSQIPAGAYQEARQRLDGADAPPPPPPLPQPDPPPNEAA